MEMLSVALTAVISVLVMFLLAKLIGNRAISQMNLFDYINSITIGSIAAELATSDLKNMHKPLTAMLIYAAAVILFAALSGKLIPFRRFVEGRTVILVQNGKLLNRNFKKAKIDVNEFLMQCRLNGYFDLQQIDTAVQESNGRISILPCVGARPVQVQDLNLSPAQEKLFSNVIVDGKVLPKNLKALGYDTQWLTKQLRRQNISDESDVFLAICNPDGAFYAFEKKSRQDRRDMFDL